MCPRGGGGGASEGKGPKRYRNYVPPRDVTGEVFGLSDAAVLTPAIGGAVSPAVFAGAPRPTLSGRMFRPLSGWNSRPLPRISPWPMMLGGSPSVIRVSEPLRAVVGVVPLIDVATTSSVVGRRPAGLSDSDVR